MNREIPINRVHDMESFDHSDLHLILSRKYGFNLQRCIDNIFRPHFRSSSARKHRKHGFSISVGPKNKFRYSGFMTCTLNYETIQYFGTACIQYEENSCKLKCEANMISNTLIPLILVY
jgi:hypothetical protein